MNARLCTALILVASLALLLTWTAAAQGPEPPPPDWPGGKPFPGPDVPGRLDAPGADAPNVPLGQPGTSFRYVQRFGTTEMAYFEDTTHIYESYGVGTDGTNVWIAESWGCRALKFTNAGAFVMQIGKAGFREAAGTSLDYVTDVAVDGSGNIWVVDGGAAHVVKFNASGQRVSELGQAWNRGAGNDRFNDAISIAFDSAGNIYVSDTGLWGDDYGNHRIQVFNSAGAYLTTIGVTGVAGSDNSHFKGPRHIAIYGSYLYVADGGNHRVQIFDVSNPLAPGYVATIGVSGVSGSDNSHFNRPMGVAVDAGYIYVADSNNHRVQVFDRTTRAYVATLGTGSCGSGNTQFCTPTDVAVDAAGNIYVADLSNDRVQQFNSSRAYVRTYGTTGVPYLTDGYHYNAPTGVAVATDGSIYITEELGHRLVKLNAAGEPQWTVGQPGICGSDNTYLCGPNGVALDSAGHVYVADTWSSHRVQIFNGDGSYYATLGTGWGTGNDQFKGPNGVAVDSTGHIYVADADNHRVQIYDNSRTYVATLGQTGVSGTDNAHFNSPRDVAVDAAGNIYVVDQANHRVQVFNSSRAYVRTIGETGVSGNDFGHFSNPTGIAVDAAGRTYVADQWGGRVQVFDNTGAYLTTIGGRSGNRTGQMRQADGLAVDNAGNLYIAEYLNHRIQKFAPGVPGWLQTNLNGFGDRQNREILTLAPFGGQLYAGTLNYGSSAQLWRTAGSPWTAVMTNGFGVPSNVGIDHLLSFGGQLYAGTWADAVNGGEVWRSANGLSWTRVISQGFGDPTNGEVYRFAVFSDTLYASTWSYTKTHGVEIWRSATGNSGAWERVVSNGLGNADNSAALSFEEFNGALYASTYNWGPSVSSGGEVWRTTNGTTWTKVITGGFGTTTNYAVAPLAAFNGYLYAGTANWNPATQTSNGGQVWRCSAASGCDEAGDWEQITSDGFGNANNIEIRALLVFENRLYAVTCNYMTGMEVWRTQDGTNWEQAGFAGFGDSNNGAPYWDNGVAVFNNRLYIGTYNTANGGEVWLYLHHRLYLPLVLRQYP